MFERLLIVTLISTFALVLILPISAHAQTVPSCSDARNPGGLLTGVDCDCAISGDCSIRDFVITLFNIGRWIVGISASIALAFVVFGGGMMILSGGNTNRIEQGKNMLRGSIVGLVIILISWITVSFIVTAFTGSGQLFENASGGQDWFNFRF